MTTKNFKKPLRTKNKKIKSKKKRKYNITKRKKGGSAFWQNTKKNVNDLYNKTQVNIIVMKRNSLREKLNEYEKKKKYMFAMIAQNKASGTELQIIMQKIEKLNKQMKELDEQLYNININNDYKKMDVTTNHLHDHDDNNNNEIINPLRNFQMN